MTYTFKVGDRVRVNNNFYEEELVGCLGEVSMVLTNCDYQYIVLMSSNIPMVFLKEELDLEEEEEEDLYV